MLIWKSENDSSKGLGRSVITHCGIRQQIWFVSILFSLRWNVELILQGRTLFLYSNFSMVYSKEEPALQCRRKFARRTRRHWSPVQGLLRESWIRGSPDSRTISFGRTVGLWRYKIEDFVPCPDRTFLGVEGKLGNMYMDISSFVTDLV